MLQEPVKLSKRLKSVAKFLPAGVKFADIGSDHAYLPCYVCMKDPAALAIAGEVNEGPFESAKENVKIHGLETRVSVRLGNGLDVIEVEDRVDHVVIAGMGGALITEILHAGKAKLAQVDRLILQPNIEARKVRQWLYGNGYHLTAEQMLEEKGHIYEILVADRQGSNPYDEAIMDKQFFFGPYLLKEKSPVFLKKWRMEKEKLTSIVIQMKKAETPNLEKIKQFTKELTWIEEVLQ